MIWVLVIFLSGTVQESVYFNDMDTCLKYAHKIGAQNWSQSLEGTKSGLKPIAFLKKWIKKREAKIPKYLTGKN